MGVDPQYNVTASSCVVWGS